MSPRRPILVLALGSLIVAGLGLRDWSIDGGRAVAFAGRALADYGLDLTAQGPASLTLLPLPRLSLARVRIAAGRDGPALAEDGRLAIDLDLPGLLAGRAAVGGLQLDGARLSPDPAAWAGPLARFARRLRAGAAERPRRIALRAARLAEDGEARDLDIDLAWPFWSASAEARGSLTWRGVPTRIALAHLRPADLAGGRPSPFTAEATWPGGSLMADGTAVLKDGAAEKGAAEKGAAEKGTAEKGTAEKGTAWPALAGTARLETRSLPETLAWIGRAAPLAPLAGAFTLEGGFETADRAVSWPSLRVGLGSNVLEGAGTVALGSGDAPRLSIQATLAAETLNLAPLVGGLVRLFEAGPLPLALGPLTRGDLDLRLSAAAGRVGPVQVDDLAASVLVRDASVEVALNRARIRDGTLKGRVLLATGADPAETEVRTQGTLDRVDLGGLLGEIGEWRWMLGPVQGQFALESSARDGAGLLAHVAGRAALAVDGGAISGLDLADVVHRNGNVAAGGLARRNGRTAFERAAVALRFSDGIGEITEAGLRGAGVGATLRGRVSLPEQRLDAQGELALRPPADPSRGVLFEIAGPWDALTAQAVPHAEGADRAARPGEAVLPNLPKLPATLGLSGTVRGYGP